MKTSQLTSKELKTAQDIEDAEIELEELLESGDLEDVLDAAFKVEDMKKGLR